MPPARMLGLLTMRVEQDGAECPAYTLLPFQKETQVVDTAIFH
jgi:hypothetical protein